MRRLSIDEDGEAADDDRSGGAVEESQSDEEEEDLVGICALLVFAQDSGFWVTF